MNEKENQKIYQEFVLEEARWLDGIVRQFIPKWVQWIIEKNSKNVIGRLGHFLVDYFLIGKILGIKITRNQDTEILGGKGYRQGMDHGYKILAVRTTVARRGKEIEQKRFPLGIHIKK
ncbi:MAG: hypothetical protein RBG13Loki_0359 [Promethearchaeota archaeon CR_4]|nr:MAG: hypothetical protein RBG13Loki_0359 [Candidatus Lokiarchaeota archaeon CR_4]